MEPTSVDPTSVRLSARRHRLHRRIAPLRARRRPQRLRHGERAGGGAGTCNPEAPPRASWCDVVVPAIAARTASRPPIALSLRQVLRHLGTTLDDQPNQSALTADLVRQVLTALGCTLAEAATNGLQPATDNLQPATFSWGRGAPGASTSSVRSTSSKRLPASMATTASPTRCPLRCPSSRIRQPPLSPPSRASACAWLLRGDLPAASHPNPTAQPFCTTNLQAPGGLIALENPLSDEARLLRPSLAPGMLAMLAHNLNRNVREVRLLEQGTIFTAPATSRSAVAQLLARPHRRPAADAPAASL